MADASAALEVALAPESETLAEALPSCEPGESDAESVGAALSVAEAVTVTVTVGVAELIFEEHRIRDLRYMNGVNELTPWLMYLKNCHCQGSSWNWRVNQR